MFLRENLLLFLLFIGYGHGDVQTQSKSNSVNGQEITDIFQKYKNGQHDFKVGDRISKLLEEHSRRLYFDIKLLEGYNNCLGIKTTSEETIVLQCPGKSSETPACFDIVSPTTLCPPFTNFTRTTQCVKKYSGKLFGCVGFITPHDWFIALECQNDSVSKLIWDESFPWGHISAFNIRSGPKFVTLEDISEWLPDYGTLKKLEQEFERHHVSRLVSKYKEKEYSFTVGQEILIMDNQPSENNSLVVQQLEEHGNCLGLKTETNETIVLQCPGKEPKEPGCFEIIAAPKSGGDNSTSPNEAKVCVDSLGGPISSCVGFSTPDSWIMVLDCRVQPFTISTLHCDPVPPRSVNLTFF